MNPTPTAGSGRTGGAAWPTGGGEAARRLRDFDGSRHPLGPVALWPRSLKLVIEVMLMSRDPMWLGWGSELFFFCNDACLSLFGVARNHAPGAPAREVWQELWNDIGPRASSVLRSRLPTRGEPLCFVQQRSGRAEETFQAFSYSPVLNDEGEIAGVLCVANEETAQLVRGRQLTLLRNLGADFAAADNEQMVFAAFARRMAEAKRELPFVLVYLFDDDAAHARLAYACGVETDAAIAPAIVDARASDAVWPAAEMLENAARVVVGTPGDSSRSSTSVADTDTPREAAVVPMSRAAGEKPTGFLVAGLNPLCPLDPEFSGFIDLLVAQLASALARVRSPARRAESSADFPKENPSPVMQLGRDGVLRYANPAALRTFARWMPVAGQPLDARLLQLLGFAETIDACREIETVVDGRVYSVSLAPDFPSDAINVYVTDVTAWKNAGDQSHLLAAIVESSDDAIVGKNLDGVITSWNRGAQKIFGYTAAEAIGRPVTILIPPDHIDEEPGILRRIRSGESIDHYETVRMRKDGSRLDISLTVSPIRDARGRIVGASKIARDITERKQNEAELAAHARRAGLLSEMAAQLLLAESPRALQAAIFHGLAREMGAEIYFHHVPSPDARTLLLESSGACDEVVRNAFATIPVGIRATGGDAAREPSPLLADEVNPADLAARLSARVPSIRGVASHALKTGERLLGTLVFASTSRDRFADAEIRFMQTVCDLVAASVERARLLAELRQARDVAEAASRAKDDFLATLSHELRTPLNPVLLLASNAAEDASLPANVRADFATIQKNVELEARLIDDLLDVTRITRGKLALEKRLYDAHAILRDAISIVQGDADQKEIELTWNLAASRHVIVGDAVRLQQVFWNVLKNALKFTPPGGRVAVETRVLEEPPRLCVTVEDSGIGMTRDELGRVFEAFAQGEHAASASTHRFGGLGLGLAISRALIQIHGGAIRAESRGRGKGSTFFIELPLHANASRAELPASPGPRLLEAEEVSKPSSDDLARESILLVDDHESTRHTLMRLLERRGYSVKAVATMAQARAVIGQHDFDLLISDIGLPDGSGNDLMRDVRQKHPRMRGIALSGHGAETDIARTGAAGFAVHLTKPVRIEELDRVLTRLRGMGRTEF